MASPLIIRELSIVVVGRNHNPSILNPDFLKFNNIVPKDWQLAQSPICTEMISQVVFNNGLTVVSQQDKIIFTEPFLADDTGSVETPGVAGEYLRMVPHVTYEAVGVNPKGHVTFESGEEALRCIRETFLAAGPWLEFGNGVRQTGVKFSYELQGRSLNLAVETTMFQAEDSETPVVVFAGNFHHKLAAGTTGDRLNSALDEVGKWEEDVRVFRDLVEEQILGGKMQCK